MSDVFRGLNFIKEGAERCHTRKMERKIGVSSPRCMTVLCLLGFAVFWIGMVTQPAEAIFLDMEACYDSFPENDTCSLPDCYCNATDIPGVGNPAFSITYDTTPQIILFTYSGPVTEEVRKQLRSAFPDEYRNPNECPIGITVFASNRSSDYCSIHQLYVRGHEIATYGLNGTNVEGISNVDWTERFLNHKALLITDSYLPDDHVMGARAPSFRLGGDRQFSAIQDGAFEYDSSLQVAGTGPLWPFTFNMYLDVFLKGCQASCPKFRYKGLWEVPVVPLRRDSRICYTLDDCVHKNADENSIADMLMNNLENRNNKAPMLINLKQEILKSPSAIEAIRIFIERLIGRVEEDVWFLTIGEMLQWVKNPTPINQLKDFEPWDCPARNFFAKCERACFKSESDKNVRKPNPFRDLLPVETLWLYQTIFLIVSFLVIFRVDRMKSKTK